MTVHLVVESERHEGDKITIERRYFIASHLCSAMKFMESVRAHWSVENSLHWCLDIGFREDESRIRKDHGPENMAIFRQMSLNMLKQEKTEKVGIYTKRLLASASDAYLELLLSGQI
ncbi:ISAs1 family transposase [Endozoicomonas ascidiicola]|uniref:ISAs1 family transposase n=1 Tax=Endozoicomonas ascidiicola TaxID=1698521 RepID=UPI000ACA36F4|nr:ISAs1 family transposase [Endozoicomonas ascidiicola]